MFDDEVKFYEFYKNVLFSIVDLTNARSIIHEIYLYKDIFPDKVNQLLLIYGFCFGSFIGGKLYV